MTMTVSPREEFSRRLRDAAAATGVSTWKLARLAGLTPLTVDRALDARKAISTVRTTLALAHAMGIQDQALAELLELRDRADFGRPNLARYLALAPAPGHPYAAWDEITLMRWLHSDPAVGRGAIYALVDPREPDVYWYIGQTAIRPRSRLLQHFGGGTNGSTLRIHLESDGLFPAMVPLRTNVPMRFLDVAEVAATVDAIRAGHPILNYHHENSRSPWQQASNKPEHTTSTCGALTPCPTCQDARESPG